MVNSNTVIIVLLCILIFLFIFDMYNRDCFSGVGGTFYNVDYKTKDVSCDDLTGTNACVVKTVRPMRKEVCNKKLNFISPNKRIGTNEINIKKVNKVLFNNTSLREQREQREQPEQEDIQVSQDGGMSLDQIDNIQDDMLSTLDLNDDVQYDLDKEREINNLKVKNYINSNKRYTNDTDSNNDNTLSDVDNQLLSFY